MKNSKSLLAASLLAAGLIAGAPSAHAVDIIFADMGSSGVDPLGHAWALTPSADLGQLTSWGEPGPVAGTERFNINSVSSSQGSYATGFLFKAYAGLGGSISSDAQTRLVDISTGEAWTTQILSPSAVLFTAPNGATLSRFDEFLINVAFDGPVIFPEFKFAGHWLDSGDTGDVGGTPGGVPEPATWALMLAGFGLMGAALRGRRARAVDPA